MFFVENLTANLIDAHSLSKAEPLKAAQEWGKK